MNGETFGEKRDILVLKKSDGDGVCGINTYVLTAVIKEQKLVQA